MTNYANAFLVKQALGKSKFKVSDYFPIIGDTVVLTNESTDSDSNTWTIKDGVNPDVSSTQLNESVVILEEDGILQKLDISNTTSTDSHEETVYGLVNPDQTYYDISLVSPIARIGDTVRIDSNAGSISIKNHTFGQSGIQLQYNSGTSRFYVGDGSNKHIKFRSSTIIL